MSNPALGRKVDLRRALGWAGRELKNHVGTWIVLALIVFIIQLIQAIGTTPLLRFFNSALEKCGDISSSACANALGPSAGKVVAVTVLLSIVLMILAAVAKYGVIRAALGMTRGRRPLGSDVFPDKYFGVYVIYALVYAALTTIGIGLCLLPGLIVLFFLQLGPFYILDRGYDVGDAIKASFSAARNNIIPVLGMSLINLGVLIISGLAYGILTLIALPFSALFTAHIFRQINGEPIE
jgi:uncharacterized membrane protein